MEKPLDSNGIEIAIGDCVAFNYSGAVKLGTVEKVTKRTSQLGFRETARFEVVVKHSKTGRIENGAHSHTIHPDKTSVIKRSTTIAIVEKVLDSE